MVGSVSQVVSLTRSAVDFNSRGVGAALVHGFCGFQLPLTKNLFYGTGKEFSKDCLLRFSNIS